MPEYYVGIDLGTTNTLVSVLRRGKLETLLVEGETICPSVVHFQGRDRAVVGRHAKRLVMLDPEHTIVSPKRHIGRFKFRYQQFGKDYTPTHVSAHILRKVKEAAEQDLGPVRKVVLTVPAYFNEDQCAATKEAGELAGFEVLRLLSEPTAAAIAYGLNQRKDQTIAVYDLGGGTFDISILAVKGNTFTVRAVGGDHRLGGDDFDRKLVTYVETEFAKATGIDLQQEPQSPELLTARQKLKEECEKQKIELSEAENTTVEIPNFYKGRHLEVTLTRDQFEALIATEVEKTVALMHETLEKARLKNDDIDRVLLVGGSTRIPLVKRKVAATIKEPHSADNVMEMVARGAAIVAAQYMAIQQKGDEALREVITISSLRELDQGISEIYPYRLGIATVQPVPSWESSRFMGTVKQEGEWTVVQGVFSEIVELGQRLPLSRKRDKFSTVMDYQRDVKIEIYRTPKPATGAVESCKDQGMQFLGDFFLHGLRPARAGEPQITVTMDIDANGILQVRAEEAGTGKAANSKPIRLLVDRDVERVAEEVDC